MKLFTKLSLGLILASTLASTTVFAGNDRLDTDDDDDDDEVEIIDSDSSKTVDFNEQIHLIFMREEEKLARDVYIMLGKMYPDHVIFGNIDDSEQRHTSSVEDKLEQYDVEDPSTNDNVGVYTGAEFGDYFTEKFNLLVEMASKSELDALYVGALIEELDMHDIHYCPDEIIRQDNGIDSVSACGMVYTDNVDIQRLYASLLDGSDSHLEAYVENIEEYIGEGNYEAQVLTQEEVDHLLDS